MICSEIGTKETKGRRKQRVLVETPVTEISGERRAHRRYEAELPLEYTALRNGRVVATGEGTTVDLSSTGTSFRVAEELEPGTYVELAIAWPAEDGAKPLQLVVSGRVVRQDRRGTAIRNLNREFRTAAVPMTMAAVC